MQTSALVLRAPANRRSNVFKLGADHQLGAVLGQLASACLRPGASANRSSRPLPGDCTGRKTPERDGSDDKISSSALSTGGARQSKPHAETAPPRVHSGTANKTQLQSCPGFPCAPACPEWNRRSGQAWVSAGRDGVDPPLNTGPAAGTTISLDLIAAHTRPSAQVWVPRDLTSSHGFCQRTPGLPNSAVAGHASRDLPPAYQSFRIKHRCADPSNCSQVVGCFIGDIRHQACFACTKTLRPCRDQAGQGFSNIRSGHDPSPLQEAPAPRSPTRLRRVARPA